MSQIDLRVEEEMLPMISVFDHIRNEFGHVVIGQKQLLERVLVAILSNGHILLEGLPGLAKTLAIKTVADCIHCGFQRIQFTPDLLPSDLIGTVIFNQKTGEFTPKMGPLFTNFVLADEVNRAPAKVQSALLEAMAEHQITLAEKTYRLSDPFIVFATQNPIEQEGTYSLPEAQLDRFMFKLKVTYPSMDDERKVLLSMTGAQDPRAKVVTDGAFILKARELVKRIYVHEKIYDYILRIVFATRNPEQFGLSSLKDKILVGMSPRASLALVKAAKAQAFLQKRNYVTPDDVKALIYDIGRHRILLSFEALANQMTPESVLMSILEKISAP